MPSTRSSTRSQEIANSSPKSDSSVSGTKRKVDDVTSPTSTKTKRDAAPKKQKTLEESLPSDKEVAKDLEREDQADKSESKQSNGHSEQSSKDSVQENDDKMEIDGEDASEKNQSENAKSNGVEESSGQEDSGKTEDKVESTSDDKKHDDFHEKEEAKSQANGESGEAVDASAVKEDSSREQAMPSNILEKGIIHFFTRGRVGVDDPDSVQDIARSYFALRPLPHGAKLVDGAIPDLKNNRLFALPKKVWPKSGKDRFMAFVEKAKVDMDTLKEEFFSGSEYNTKTVGVRSTPDITPVGEGVYAMTTTGGGQGTTHLVYMLTIPAEISEVQHDLGLAEKGSFVVSLKNPKSSGPANAQLPEVADFPQEFFDEFRGRGWMPAQPKHLDYANAQVLLIGEDFDSSNNLEPAVKDEKKDNKETPQEELEKLEEEDEHRVHNLRGDDTVFADLGISSKDYPKVLTTW
jgi:hypothetical protein